MLLRARLWVGLAVLALGSLSFACEEDADPAPGALPFEVGGARPVSIDAPNELVAGRRYPLILVLHGYSSNALVTEAWLQLTPLRFEPGAVLVAPEGLVDSRGNQYWNASPVCCDFDGRRVDDVAYLGGLLDEVLATWPIDRSRVLVVGASNGGFMAHRMACERADVITAIAAQAGADVSADGSGCAPKRPVSVLHLHGTADQDVWYDGIGDGPGGLPSANATVEHWAKRNGCSGSHAGTAMDLDVRVAGDETEVRVFDGCPVDGAVELWTMRGSPHLPDWAPTFGASLWAWLDAHPRAAP